MKQDAFDRFAAKAAYYFGASENESADLLDALEAEGFRWGKNRLGNSHWGERAAELLEAEKIIDYEEAFDSEYFLEDEDDEWLEPDVDYEISGDYLEDLT